MGAILSVHPHRVALSAVGRCEVFQKIGGPASGGLYPAGPHTNLPPDLMKAGRTHSANTPIPNGFIPAMSLHPGNPVMGPLGEDREFDANLFTAFQDLLAVWGREAYVMTKRRIWDALDADAPPEPEDHATTRVERTARRNALRQRARLHGRSLLLLEWSNAHDQGAFDADAECPDIKRPIKKHRRSVPSARQPSPKRQRPASIPRRGANFSGLPGNPDQTA